MAINKVPNNYYNDTNIRRDKINTIIDHVNELDTHAVVPTPAAGDVGKVVKVGSDGYELASDAGAKLVVATVTADGQGNLSCDKTYAELSASIANGDIVELSYSNQTFVYSGTDFSGIHFVSARNDGVVHNVITAWTISSSNIITFLIESINSELPAYSSADEGKFLGVVSNGSLVFADVPNEVPTPTSADAGKVLTVDSNGAWELKNQYIPIIFNAGNYILGIPIDDAISMVEHGINVMKTASSLYYISSYNLTNKVIKASRVEYSIADSSKYMSINTLEFSNSINGNYHYFTKEL